MASELLWAVLQKPCRRAAVTVHRAGAEDGGGPLTIASGPSGPEMSAGPGPSVSAVPVPGTPSMLGTGRSADGEERLQRPGPSGPGGDGDAGSGEAFEGLAPSHRDGSGATIITGDAWPSWPSADGAAGSISFAAERAGEAREAFRDYRGENADGAAGEAREARISENAYDMSVPNGMSRRASGHTGHSAHWGDGRDGAGGSESEVHLPQSLGGDGAAGGGLCLD